MQVFCLSATGCDLSISLSLLEISDARPRHDTLTNKTVIPIWYVNVFPKVTSHRSHQAFPVESLMARHRPWHKNNPLSLLSEVIDSSSSDCNKGHNLSCDLSFSDLLILTSPDIYETIISVHASVLYHRASDTFSQHFVFP